MRRLSITLAALAPLGLAAAAGEAVVVSGNGASGTRDCRGGAAVVDGSRNQLTLQGCRSVTVNGNDNTLDVGSPESLAVFGSRNKLSWRPGAGGRRTKVANVGSGNTVSESAEAPSASSSGGEGAGVTVGRDAGVAMTGTDGGRVEISGSGGSVTISGGGVEAAGLKGIAISVSHERRTYDCHGGAAMISGDDNDL